MGDVQDDYWRAVPNDLVGGWCVVAAVGPQQPSAGAVTIGDFMTEGLAKHVAGVHNLWIDSGREPYESSTFGASL